MGFFGGKKGIFLSLESGLMGMVRVKKKKFVRTVKGRNM